MNDHRNIQKQPHHIYQYDPNILTKISGNSFALKYRICPENIKHNIDTAEN
jgi:hypothetical protein